MSSSSVDATSTQIGWLAGRPAELIDDHDDNNNNDDDDDSPDGQSRTTHLLLSIVPLSLTLSCLLCKCNEWTPDRTNGRTDRIGPNRTEPRVLRRTENVC